MNSLGKIREAASKFLKSIDVPYINEDKPFQGGKKELEVLIERGKSLIDEAKALESPSKLESGCTALADILLSSRNSFFGAHLPTTIELLPMRTTKAEKFFELLKKFSDIETESLKEKELEVLLQNGFITQTHSTADPLDHTTDYLLKVLPFIIRYFNWFLGCNRHFRKWRSNRYRDSRIDDYDHTYVWVYNQKFCIGSSHLADIQTQWISAYRIVTVQVELAEDLLNDPPTLQWPDSLRIGSALPNRSSKKPWIRVQLKKGDDVTLGSSKLINDFRPDISVTGYETYRELAGGSANAMFFRTIANEAQNELCLQYLWVFLKQTGSVSTLYMATIPLLAFLWTWFVSSAFSMEITLLHQWLNSGQIVSLLLSLEVWTVVLATLILGVTLFITGVYPHLEDMIRITEGSRIRFRNTTFLIPVGVIVMLLFWSPFWVQNVAFILFLIGFIPWILERLGRLPTTHDMDYAPIFVWVKRREGAEPGTLNSNDWVFDRACWDKFHYYSDRFDSRSEKDRTILTDGKRIPLTMDNAWHSFSLQTEARHIPLYFKWIALLGFFLGIITWAGGYIYFGTILVVLSAILGHIVLVTYSSHWNYIESSHHRELKDPRSSREHDDENIWWKRQLKRNIQPYHLTKDRLSVFWNFGVKESRLVIRTKFQDPFNDRPEFFSTFRDDTEYMMLDLVSRMQDLENKKTKA